MAEGLDNLNSAILGFKEVVTNQPRTLDVIIKMLNRQEDRVDSMEADIKNITFYLSRVFDVQRQLNDLSERVDKLEHPI